MRARASPHTPSLFDDDPAAGSSLAEVLARAKPVSKAQQNFERLVVKIEAKREELKQWQAYLPRYNQRLADEFMPMLAKLRAGRRQMVEFIDELLSRPTRGRRLTRLQRTKLAHLLRTLLADLLDDKDDEALDALFDKYNEVSRTEVRQSELELAEALLSDAFGLEIGDVQGASSAEELLARAKALMQDRAEQEALLANEKQDERAAKRSKASAAKADAAKARRDEATREIGQSLRDVYRKLVSALHPDREPEPEARKRKTQLMQKVNQAYEANDLLTLLSIQLEIEQIDAGHLSAVPAHRLAHYIEILREQLAGLESELAQCTQLFDRMDRGGTRLTPAIVDRELNIDIARIRTQVRELQKDLERFRDPALLRVMLEDYPLEQGDMIPDGLIEFVNILQGEVNRSPADLIPRRRRGPPKGSHRHRARR